MPKPSSAMEIFQHLEKSNCRECGEKTCLAFAASVYRLRKPIDMCPRIDSEIMERYSIDSKETSCADLGERFVEDLKRTLKTIDLAEAASRTGGVYDGRRLTLKIMGKDFGVDSAGNFTSDIHIKPMISAPFLAYVIYSKGVGPTGEWVSFRELNEARDFSYPFFQKRCESALRRIADTYTDLFEDLVHIFCGQKVAEQFESDVSVVLHPLPKVPIMICYRGSEDGLGSTLNLFFDRSVDENLPKGALFNLCVGLALMFEKISHRHAA